MPSSGNLAKSVTTKTAGAASTSGSPGGRRGPGSAALGGLRTGNSVNTADGRAVGEARGQCHSDPQDARQPLESVKWHHTRWPRRSVPMLSHRDRKVQPEAQVLATRGLRERPRPRCCPHAGPLPPGVLAPRPRAPRRVPCAPEDRGLPSALWAFCGALLSPPRRA